MILHFIQDSLTHSLWLLGMIIVYTTLSCHDYFSWHTLYAWQNNFVDIKPPKIVSSLSFYSRRQEVATFNMKEVTTWLLTYFPVAWSAHICQVNSHHVMLHVSTCYSGPGDGHPRPQSALPGPHGGGGKQGDQLHLDCAGGGQLPVHPGRGGRVQGENSAWSLLSLCV